VFEGAAGFSIKINHGTAVLLGMMLAIELAYNKKILSIKDLKLIKKHYKNLNLPYKFSMYFKKNKINKIIYFMKKDKKNTNKKINLILLKKIGKTTKPNNFDIDGQKLKRFLVENYR
jgi:3-dehydroquinate synthetase